MGFVHQDITVEERVQVGLLAAALEGRYGLVTDLSRALGTSRQFIYRLRERVQTAVAEALTPGSPGPMPRRHALMVDRDRLDRAILTLALVGHGSQRAIIDCLAEIYEVEPSLGYVNRVLQEAGQTAAAFNEDLRLSLGDAQVEADELFVGETGNLVVVDHPSLLILALEQPEHCDGNAWQAVLKKLPARGVEVQRLGADGGKALAQAVRQRVGVELQLDRWHELRHITRCERVVERAAYKAMGREGELEKKARKMDPHHAMGGEVWRSYREARSEATRQAELYDQLHVVCLWVREALEAVERRTGRVRTRQECLEELGAATALMRRLKVDEARALADHLDESGPMVLRYADHLREQMEALAREMGEEGVRRLCREWLLGREVGEGRRAERAERKGAYEHAHLVALLYWGEEYVGARAKVQAVLEGVMRGSSLAECVNSWLRPYADLMKGLGQHFLPLFVLYRNSHVFERGKRAGQSPLELAGVPTPPGDWLEWLGLGPKYQATRSVRSLPKPA